MDAAIVFALLIQWFTMQERMRFPLVILMLQALLAIGCRSSSGPIPSAWLTPLPAEGRESVMRAAPVIDGVTIERDGRGVRIVRNGVDLTEPFAAIESFDVSRDRGEVAFSARRAHGFDIGLVHVEGSPISWVPEDRGDEVQVQWAPRGNKISYFVRSRGGDLVRTVHIPTATALTVDFPFSVLRSLEWDAPAERFTVVAESPDSSPRTEQMRYGGEERRVLVPPGQRLDVEIVPLGAGLLLQPRSIRYDEKLPLVVWVSGSPLNSWRPRLGQLLAEVRAAAIVIDRAPDESLWTAAGQLGWVDRSRVYVMDGLGGIAGREGTLTIRGDRGVSVRRFRRSTNSITVQPADVESFAAGFIADQLKETRPRGH